MEMNQKVILAKSDNTIRDNLISEYSNFIKARISETVKRNVTESDDEYSIGLMAFNEAINSYNEDKGNFLSFASIVIKNRIINHIKTESKYSKVVPFSSLSTQDEDGDEISFDVEDEKATIESNEKDITYEIDSIKKELEQYNISFFDLPKCSPKAQKTKDMCMEVIRFIKEKPILIENLKEKKTLPSSILLKELKINEKLLERHRKYIISSIIILTGDYENIAEYIKM